MAGLDNIINKILEEAKSAADQKITDAKEQADFILQQAQTERAALESRICKQAEAEAANAQKRAESAAELQRKSQLLYAKQDMIARVIEKAYQTIRNMAEDDYFRMIEKILEEFALPEAGEIYFSEADLTRMPSGFKETMQSVAEKKGGSIQLASCAKEMECGFILAYGGIEENCTVKALLNARKEKLQDKVNAYLFD